MAGAACFFRILSIFQEPSISWRKNISGCRKARVRITGCSLKNESSDRETSNSLTRIRSPWGRLILTSLKTIPVIRLPEIVLTETSPLTRFCRLGHQAPTHLLPKGCRGQEPHGQKAKTGQYTQYQQDLLPPSKLKLICFGQDRLKNSVS